jgi:hypothetical protein
VKATPKVNRTKDATPRRRGRIVAIATCATVVLALAGGGLLWHRHQSRVAEALAASQNYANLPQITLDPQAFQGEARETYRIARENPALLAKLHCYCRCDERLGHRNLLDCYRDVHAASCGICMGEARDADQMAKQGTSVEDIRATLKARYENGE